MPISSATSARTNKMLSLFIAILMSAAVVLETPTLEAQCSDPVPSSPVEAEIDFRAFNSAVAIRDARSFQ